MYYFLNYFLTNYGASNSKNKFLFSESTADWRHHVAMFRNRIRRKDIKKLRCIKIPFDILFIYLRCIKISFDIYLSLYLFTQYQNSIWHIIYFFTLYQNSIRYIIYLFTLYQNSVSYFIYLFTLYQNYISIYYLFIYWARGGVVGWGTALQAWRLRVRFPMVSLEFFIRIILPAELWPCGWFNL